MAPVLLLVCLSGFLGCASRTVTPVLPAGVKKENLQLKILDQRVSATLYRPPEDENAPLLIIAHGFMRSKRYMAGWGGYLAKEGFKVIIPTQPKLANHELNGRVLAALVDQFREKRKVGLIGFSMGGLTTLLATTHTRVDAWVGLDPVDMNGEAKVAAASLKAPSALFLADPQAWNMHGNANDIAGAIQGSKRVVRIKGSSHLDAEWPTDLIGQIACGLVKPQHQTQFREGATSFLKSTLLPPL